MFENGANSEKTNSHRAFFFFNYSNRQVKMKQKEYLKKVLKQVRCKGQILCDDYEK